MTKVFTFKGKDFESLKGMTIEEFAKLLPSRQRRNLLRGLTDKQKKLLIRMRKTDVSKALKTHCREMIIIPEMVGRRLLVHNGKEWIPVDIKPEMLGHRLGEFALTRKRVIHSAPGVGATKSSKSMPLK